MGAGKRRGCCGKPGYPQRGTDYNGLAFGVGMFLLLLMLIYGVSQAPPPKRVPQKPLTAEEQAELEQRADETNAFIQGAIMGHLSSSIWH